MVESLVGFLGGAYFLKIVVYGIGAALGQVLHAIKKWADSDVDSPEQWMTTNTKRTIGSVIGNIAIMYGFVQTGALETVTALTALNIGIFQGISSDSILNKGSRTTWSAERRSEFKEKINGSQS